jgi:hypothetical protein
MKLRVGVAVSTLVALGYAVPCLAQDPVAVDPMHHKIEFENAQVRVLRIVLAPGEKSVMHQHPCLIAIGLSDADMTFHLPDGSSRPVSMRHGQVVPVKGPFLHNPENTGSTLSEVIAVEMKSGCDQ